MRLIRVSIGVAAAAIARLASGLLVAKMVAVYAGPAGMAAFGQFQSIASLLAAFGNGGISAGTVKYLSQHREAPGERERFRGTSLAISCAVSLACALLLALLAEPVAIHVIGDVRHTAPVIALAAAAAFIALQTTVHAVLTGLNRLRPLFASQVAGSALTAALALLLVPRHGLAGALYALAIAQVAAAAVTIAFSAPTLGFAALRPKFDRAAAGKLARYSVMAATSALCVPVTHVVVRNHLSAALSPADAGIWHAMWRLSDAYLLFFTTLLSVYYLPRVSALVDPVALRRFVWRSALVLLPVTAATALLLYALRGWLIMLLFSREFLPIGDLLPLQLFGDLMKVASWLLGYLMIARARVGLFVASEIVFSASFAVLVVLLVANLGLAGAAAAHVANYVAYLVFLAWVFRRELFGRVPR